jgi:twitching motility protein PilT
MAAIDSLLMLIDAQQASGIVLRTKEAPVLVGGKGRGLTMPPLDRPTIETFAADVLSEQDMEKLLRTGSCDAVFRSDRHGAFTVEAQSSADKLSLKLRRGAGAMAKPAPPASPAAAPAPVTVATAAASPPAAPAAAVVDDVARGALMSRLMATLAQCSGPNVTDIILSAGQPPWVRTATGLAPSQSSSVISAPELRAFVDTLVDPARRRQLDSAGSVDLAWQPDELPSPEGDGPQRFRVNVFVQTGGLAAALRPISRRAPSFVELNLPDGIGALAAGAGGGLVLVVGPTGSGKTSTLAAMVETVNRSRACHVITLEDPIEFVYQPRRCLIHQREVGTHVESFAAGLRAALRERPDIILVGEMRDRETVAMALTAAETGHLVLSTLHSGSAAMAIDRIVDVFPENQQGQIRQELAGSLRAVLTQQLLQGIRPGTRFPALELLTVNYAVAALIREGKTHQLVTQIQTGRDDGMIAFEASLQELVRLGRVSREQAMAAARDPAELQRRLREIAG